MSKSKNFFNKFDIKLIIIGILTSIILFMRMCTDEPQNKNKIIRIKGKDYQILKIDTIIKKVEQTVYKKGKDIYHDTTIYVNIPQNVDTNQILKDYYSYNVYIDSLKLKDSLGLVTITDTIFQNKIKNRKWNTSINKFETNTTLAELPRNQVYFGLNTSNLIHPFGVSFILKTKKEKMYLLGGGIDSDKKINIQLGVFWKISLRKN
jgi:hypothetical protein